MAEQRIRASWVAKFQSGPVKGQGIVRNASASGMFVATSALPEQGEAIDLELAPSKGSRLRASGIVWWTTATAKGSGRSEPGFGLRILVEDGSYRNLIDSLSG